MYILTAYGQENSWLDFILKSTTCKKTEKTLFGIQLLYYFLTDPGPKIGSIVVEGELIQETENGISTQTMMEAFQHYLFRQFRIRLSSENDYISLEPDISAEYEGFSWEIGILS